MEFGRRLGSPSNTRTTRQAVGGKLRLRKAIDPMKKKNRTKSTSKGGEQVREGVSARARAQWSESRGTRGESRGARGYKYRTCEDLLFCGGEKSVAVAVSCNTSHIQNFFPRIQNPIMNHSHMVYSLRVFVNIYTATAQPQLSHNPATVTVTVPEHKPTDIWYIYNSPQHINTHFLTYI